jgi:RNA polymerase sigma factor (sigma-70 family)
LRSREEAEDATQTTFLNAFRGLQRGVTPELEQAWLYKIAENVCLSRARSAVRRLRVESPVDLDPLHESVAAPQRGRDELHGIQDALAALPEQQRRAILLREWQGLSYAEIATELGISQGAVETLIFRARRSLARALEGQVERRGRLRQGANLGSLLAWLKSIALGGSTAVKVAAVVAAGSAVVAAGIEQRPARHAALAKTRSAASTIAPAPIALSHLQRPSAVPQRRPQVMPAAATTHRRPAGHRPAAAAPRSWPQHVPSEAEATESPAEPKPGETPPASGPAGSAPAKPHPVTSPTPAPATQRGAPADDDADGEEPEETETEGPKPDAEKPSAPRDRPAKADEKKPEEPAPAPRADEKPKKR